MKISLKNKSLKNFKIIVIILLVVGLLMSLLSYFNLYTEGFSSDEQLADYSSESCDNENTSTAVPACYATVQKNRGNDYLNMDDSDYILKTQIETPVCPNSPFEYGNSGGFGSLITEDSSINTPNDNWLQRGRDISSNVYNINVVNNIPTTPDSTPSTITSSYVIDETLSNDSAQNNMSGLPNMDNLTYPVIDSPPQASETGTMTSPTSENYQTDLTKCPPCPACERCPEPVVECKKVVNYSSASNQGMLPVPIINDFSKF